MENEKKHRLLFGLVTFGVIVGMVLMFWAMGKYERGRRVSEEEEYRGKFEALTKELPDMDTLRRIRVSYKERVQPLDSVARSKLREYSGKRELYGADPVLLFMSLCYDTSESFGWHDVPLFFIKHARNREVVGLSQTDKLATWNQIQNDKVSAIIDEQQEMMVDTPGLVPEVDRELFRLRALCRDADHLAARLLIVPPAPQQEAVDDEGAYDWSLVSGASGHPEEKLAALDKAGRDLANAWRARRMDDVNDAASRLASLSKELGPDHYPADDRIETEISFNQASPIKRSSYFYLASAIIMMFALFLQIGWARWLAIGVGTAGLVMHGWGLYLRTTLGFGVTITNLYESMIAMAAACMLICVILDAVKRIGWFTMAGGLSAFFLLEITEYAYAKFDDGIGGTIAVLANNVWVHIHVPVVMTSYAAYMIAFVLATIGLIWTLFADRRGKTPELRTLLTAAGTSVNIGSILIFAGIVLGGVWADVSWGRFWGWDPKETWALILFLYYIVIVHGRFTKWLTPFWSCWAMFFGGGVMLWTYYGSNELFSGLHSYANSAGDTTFWDNLVHDRNRWFVHTSAGFLVVMLVTAVWYLATGGEQLEDGQESETDAIEGGGAPLQEGT